MRRAAVRRGVDGDATSPAVPLAEEASRLSAVRVRYNTAGRLVARPTSQICRWTSRVSTMQTLHGEDTRDAGLE